MSAGRVIGKANGNLFTRDGKSLVSMISSAADLKRNILKAVDLIGGFDRIVEKNDEFLLKPNFNTDDPPPASSDPDFAKAVIELLYEHGAAKVILGESSMVSTSTRRVLENTGMMRKAEEAGAEVVCFDEGKWVKVDTGGEHLKKASLPERALKEKKLVHVCCMKTHKWAKFTLSMKLSVGFMKPSERLLLHSRHLEEKIADLNLVVRPCLAVIDGRSCFINGGPACGELRNPNIVMASGDRIALDVEAVKVIASYEGTSLTQDPWHYTQVRRAIDLGLGARSEQEYIVIGK